MDCSGMTINERLEVLVAVRLSDQSDQIVSKMIANPGSTDFEDRSRILLRN
jgi:hypothetical protein